MLIRQEETRTTLKQAKDTATHRRQRGRQEDSRKCRAQPERGLQFRSLQTQTGIDPRQNLTCNQPHQLLILFHFQFVNMLNMSK